jgi:hypothetical protein
VPQDADGNANVMDKGLGDTIARVTKATGIKKAVETVVKVINIDCGCPGRQDMLNKAFPYKQKPNK